jgi:hypothetical protein
LGGTQDDEATSIELTRDSGYVVVGGSTSSDFDVSANNGILDYWIVKLNFLGGIEWQKSVGGSDADMATSVQQTSDHDYVVSGFSISNDFDISSSHGSSDYWFLKLSTDSTLKISEMTLNHYHIYPSIVTDFIYIEEKIPGELGHYKILDLEGRVCKEGVFSKVISISDLSAKLYFIQFTLNTGIAISKFIKE